MDAIDADISVPGVLEHVRRAHRDERTRRARTLMNDLHYRVLRRDAEQAFVRAKRLEALYELYLSDAVREKMAAVRHAMAKVSAGSQTTELAVAELQSVMREELAPGRLVQP